MVVAEHAAEKIAAFKVSNGTSTTPSTPSSVPSTPVASAAASSAPVASAAASEAPSAVSSAAPSATPTSIAQEVEYTLEEFIAFLEKADAKDSSKPARRMKRNVRGEVVPGRRYY